jgi:hypothetical protein
VGGKGGHEPPCLQVRATNLFPAAVTRGTFIIEMLMKPPEEVLEGLASTLREL